MYSLVGGILRTEVNAVEKARMNGLRREFWCEVLRKSAEMIHVVGISGVLSGAQVLSEGLLMDKELNM